jgi:hypothetical protein
MAQARYSGLTASGLYAFPSNTMGIGNPQMPDGKCEQTTGIGDTAADFHKQEAGSGDLVV